MDNKRLEPLKCLSWNFDTPMKKLLILFVLLLTQGLAHAQSTFIPYNRDYYHLIDRFQIKYGNSQNLLQTTFKPLRRVDVSNFLLSIKDHYDSLSPQDQFNYEYLMNDNWEWTNSPFNENDKSWWDLMYDKKSDFLTYGDENFSLRINPVIEFSGGHDPDAVSTLYTNTRGIEAQGMIDNKIGFYTFLTTTQAVFPNYVFNYIRGPRQAFPNEGFWKRSGNNGWDFFHARGYITFNATKSIDVQAGYDKQFIGNGLRSMILSDFSSPFLFLKLNTRLGPFNYTNLFAELTEDIEFGNLDPGDGNYPKKFMAFHRLSINFLKKFELGVFESIISDQANINYFNPLIFYRAIELQAGSPDNAIIGLDFRANLNQNIQLYAQGVIDEFRIDALRRQTGNWRNKFGAQIGLKYLDALNIPNLDIGFEFNTARPYLYASENVETSYTNYRNPLAHPLGGNFRELILTGRYQPFGKLTLSGKIFINKRGEDEAGLNYGGNPLLSTNTRALDDGVVIGQGVSANSTFIELSGAYMLVQNLFVDLRTVYRNFSSESAARSNNSFITMLSLRWNLPQRQHEF